MSRSHLARALALSFALTLAADSVWAGPRRHREESGSAWSVVTQLWRSLTASWSDVGCWIDPNGACGTSREAAPPPETEVGCWIDPHGGCGTGQAPASPPDAEIGCWIDPYGACGTGD
jgi:hypothetical protein